MPTIHAVAEATPPCNPDSDSKPLLPSCTSEAISTLVDEISCGPSACSFPLLRRSTTSFSECIEVCEFSPEPDLSPVVSTNCAWSSVENMEEHGKQEQQDIVMRNIVPQVDHFSEGVERREIRKSVTVNVGLRSFSTVSLSVQESGLWRRRKLANNNSMV
mmetsp:Transcript_8056/g.14823  ORF Transcript_8056/g.14823 Transcript_8056/m.14823 type:complete len:160 (+) Transcript_8056:82-561(+)